MKKYALVKRLISLRKFKIIDNAKSTHRGDIITKPSKFSRHRLNLR